MRKEVQNANEEKLYPPPPPHIVRVAKTLFLLLIALSITLSFTSCKNDDEEKPNTDPKSIKFTDFDGGIITEAGITTFPCSITVVLLPEGTTDMAEAFANFVAGAWWNEVPADAVNYSYLTLSLWTGDGKEWTGTGTYDVAFVISTAPLTNDLASFASIKAAYSTKSISFTTKETPVSWGKLEKQPLQ
jgi:hypothetical protein